MWYNQVMVSKATTLLGQTGITLLALAMICFLVYKLTKAIGGRHRTPLQNTGAPQANSSVVHVHNAVQFREESRGSHTRDRVSKIVVPLEKYNDNMSIEAWLTRLELHLETELDKEDWARETLKLLSDKALKKASPIDRFLDQPNGYVALKEKLFSGQLEQKRSSS
jgi:hypothetical protein